MKLKYLLAFVLCLWAVTPAKAELQIDVNGAIDNQFPIAFPEINYSHLRPN